MKCCSEDDCVPWQEDLSRSIATVMVIDQGGIVRAYATAWQVIDETQIMEVAVDPTSRRQGLGLSLVLGLLDALMRSAHTSTSESCSVPCEQAGNDSTQYLASGWMTFCAFQARPAQPNYVLHCRPSNGSCATLEVRASNEAALAMYRKAGFRAAGFRRAYYSDGEDAVLMNLEAGNTR